MSISLSTRIRNAMLDALGGELTTVKIYSGTPPGVEMPPIPETLLASIDVNLPQANNGVIWLEVPTTVAASASGIASWARWSDAGGTKWVDGVCGTSSGAGVVFVLSSLTIVADEPVTLTSLRLTQPAS